MKIIPTRTRERDLAAAGFACVVGVDEAGCGALAGPVVAGAVSLQLDASIVGVRDSKLLTAKARERLYDDIVRVATGWHIGMASVSEINEFGIRPSTLLAMRRAVLGIDGVQFALVDAWTIPDLSFPQQGIIRGDQTIHCIAAASILAKVTRDRLMQELSRQYPQYGFAVHKGYGTQQHRERLEKYGMCAAHRKAFVHLSH